jgi:xanthine dehydrogenase YagR molybdenum-binding subunit
MKMDTAAPANFIDKNEHGWIGKPVDRVDGILKVTGKATYAYEFVNATTAYGHVLGAAIAKGKIVSIDTEAAEREAGVLLIMTYKNAPSQPEEKEKKTAPQLYGKDVTHFGQPVALVVAETPEAARAATYLIKVSYQKQKGSYSLKEGVSSAKKPKPQQNPPDTAMGDFSSAFAGAPLKVDATYTTPTQIHSQMEPHATLAEWKDDALTLYTSNQMLNPAQKVVAATLKLSPEKVRIVSKYIGGGFGSKLDVYPDAVLAAMAARQLKRPVKIALTRQQLFHMCSHRTETIQRVRLGADKAGRLSAISHEVWCANQAGKNFYESAADQTRSLYAAPHRMTSHRLVELDLPAAGSMRAPGEAVGLLALECAMDELAEAMGIDPIELRILNEPSEDPEKHIPFSTRNLVPCLKEGARRFGWSQRNARPSQVREGRWLVGIGMASAIRGNPIKENKAKVILGTDGVLTVRTAMTDIGTGTYTVLTQIGAEAFGLPLAKVKVEIGDTDFPEGAGSGGSWGAGSSGSAVFDACQHLRRKLLDKAGITDTDAQFADGNIHTRGRIIPLADVVGNNPVEAEGELEPGDMRKKYSQFSYGAHFAEVGVDVGTGEIRLRRMLGVFTAGRILNEKTARSQAIGGMVFGIGAALTEEAVIDKNFGFFVNHDMAEYHVPTNADVPQIDAIYLKEADDKSNPLKTKGLGELGICGAGAAIANAVYNATGIRIRDYPLTLDKVLTGSRSSA